MLRMVCILYVANISLTSLYIVYCKLSLQNCSLQGTFIHTQLLGSIRLAMNIQPYYCDLCTPFLDAVLAKEEHYVSV